MNAPAGLGELLRGEQAFAANRATAVPWRRLGAAVIAAGFVYGAAMGFFNGRPEQSLVSGMKVPLLLAVSTLVGLPCLAALATVLGLRDGLSGVLTGVLASQAVLAVCLASLAPVVLVTYLASDSYAWAVAVNGACFALASLAGHATLRRHSLPDAAQAATLRLVQRAWLVIYVVTAIQSAWVLRPFVGDPTMEVAFFREDAWSNAYVQVAEVIWRVATGR